MNELAQKLIDLVSQITGIQPYSQNRQSPVKLENYQIWSKLEKLDITD